MQGVVTRVKGFEQGLKEALLTKGPMTVSVDAGHEDFRFYKSGIYNNTACHTVPVTGALNSNTIHNFVTLPLKYFRVSVHKSRV